MANFIISGFADEIAPELDVQLEVLNKLGIKYIEMRGVNGKPLIDYSIAEVKEIKRDLNEAGIKLSSIGSYLGKQHITDPFVHLEKLEHVLEIADLLEVKNIRMFSFHMSPDMAEEYRDEVMDRWSRFVDCVKGTDFMLLHENEKGIYGDTAERCLDLLETINSPNLSLCFDPANFVQCDVETWPHAWEMLKDHVTYMHIKDSIQATKEVVPSGQGDGKIFEILNDLNKRQADFFLSLEPHLADFQGFADLEDEDSSLPKGDGVSQFILARNALVDIINKLN